MARRIPEITYSASRTRWLLSTDDKFLMYSFNVQLDWAAITGIISQIQGAFRAGVI
ncbi:hypothetical protein COLO4_05228 [Corchorus olitorius]|uniref:Uncharacterized protein n=1 Tax=Corchorus olitorius TaxID=93759 RepID=A0A1R3KRG7_9ROSI|nr:hypothetical protein COLO4_05228 [Corchorus olitorius]